MLRALFSCEKKEEKNRLPRLARDNQKRDEEKLKNGAAFREIQSLRSLTAGRVEARRA
jgi:hypothetical protein